jgi:cytochrome c
MLRSSSAILAIGILALAATGGPPQADEELADDEAIIELAWDSGCFNCHDVHEQIRGPAWIEVAKRYRGDSDALERLVKTVIEGGSGNWGDDVMSPNRRVPEEDVRMLVAWLLALE